MHDDHTLADPPQVTQHCPFKCFYPKTVHIVIFTAETFLMDAEEFYLYIYIYIYIYTHIYL